MKTFLPHPFCLTSGSKWCHSFYPPASPLHNCLSFRQSQKRINALLSCFPYSLATAQSTTEPSAAQMPFLSNLLFLLSSDEPTVFAAVSSESGFLNLRPDVFPFKFCLSACWSKPNREPCLPRSVDNSAPGLFTFRFSHITAQRRLWNNFAVFLMSFLFFFIFCFCVKAYKFL